MVVVLPFDSHNHIHMGPSVDPVLYAGGVEQQDNDRRPRRLCGMALQSTGPHDYDTVVGLARTTRSGIGTDTGIGKTANAIMTVVPCLGIHPWWLHTLTDEDWSVAGHDDVDDDDGDNTTNHTSVEPPRWVRALRDALRDAPTSAAVGETGLDGFHFHPVTESLACPMERQVEAFRWHLELAHSLNKPVSVHCVQAFGPLMETLSRLKKQKRLPRRIYFHAFGGKVGTIDQLTALCETLYFGFAAVVNFRSPKTADVIRKVGLERLVLETDHEDAALVHDSMAESIRFIAQALAVDEQQVIVQTTRNAEDLYGISLS
jgi:Tat protein secretion system quality control protein TatD with DNase activity